MKHSYMVDCDCARCTRERARRSAQGMPHRLARAWPTRKRSTSSKRPIVGSAEWAETRGDDLGYSGNY